MKLFSSLRRKNKYADECCCCCECAEEHVEEPACECECECEPAEQEAACECVAEAEAPKAADEATEEPTCACCCEGEAAPSEQADDDVIIDFSTIDAEYASQSTLSKVLDAGAAAGHAVATGASKVAEVAGPVVVKTAETVGPVLAKGAKTAGKGLLKATSAGLSVVGKGFSLLGKKLLARKGLPESTERHDA